MNIQYVLFVRTFEDDSSLWGSYAETTNSCAEGLPDLPTRDNPLLKPSLREICEDYKRIEIQGLQQAIADTLPHGCRKIFDWHRSGIYFDSRVNQESLDEFRRGLGLAV